MCRYQPVQLRTSYWSSPTDLIEHLQEQGPDQFLGRDRFPSRFRIDAIDQAVEAAKRGIDQCADRSQRVIGWDEIVQLGDRKEALLHPVRSAHFQAPQGLHMVSRTTAPQTPFTRERISTAC